MQRRAATPKIRTDTTPKHGGVFLRSSGRERYFEGVYLRPGVLKIFLYDKYTQPVQGAFVKGEIEVSRPPSGARIPLKLADDGTLVAALPPTAFPLQVGARLTMTYTGLHGVKPFADHLVFDFDRYTDQAPAPPGSPARPVAAGAALLR